VKRRLGGLTVAFLGLALAFSAFSFAASGRRLTAFLAVVAGIVVFLLGRRLLLAAGMPRAE
jgi:hypothetical protein